MYLLTELLDSPSALHKTCVELLFFLQSTRHQQPTHTTTQYSRPAGSTNDLLSLDASLECLSRHFARNEFSLDTRHVIAETLFPLTIVGKWSCGDEKCSAGPSLWLTVTAPCVWRITAARHHQSMSSCITLNTDRDVCGKQNVCHESIFQKNKVCESQTAMNWSWWWQGGGRVTDLR